MRVEQFKILAAARIMGTFTKPELVARTGVEKDTVNSLFRRQAGRLFERTSEKRRASQHGKPAEVWRILPERMEELSQLIDADRDAAQRELIDPDTAKEAMADDHARWQARVSLFDAIDAGQGPVRKRCLRRVDKWIAHEERRLDHWSVGAAVPKEVVEDLKNLHQRARAVSHGVDLLGDVRELATLTSATEWFRKQGELFNDGNPDAFAPLALKNSDRPEEVLAEAVLMSFEFDGIPRDRLIIAAITCLPSLGAGRSRTLICKMLDRLSGEIGKALEDGLSRPHREEREVVYRMILLVLIGFDSFPELLVRTRFATVRAWFDNLPFSDVWQPYWGAHWDRLARHTGKDPKQVRKILHAVNPNQQDTTSNLKCVLGSMILIVPESVRRASERMMRLYHLPPAPPRGGHDWIGPNRGRLAE